MTRPNQLCKLFIVTISILFVTPLATACPCFNHDHLIRQFQNQTNVSCHLIEIDNSNIISIRIRDNKRIASAGSTNCRLTIPFQNVSHNYLSYQQPHQNCVREIIRACKRLNLSIEGADTVLKSKMYGI